MSEEIIPGSYEDFKQKNPKNPITKEQFEVLTKLLNNDEQLDNFLKVKK